MHNDQGGGRTHENQGGVKIFIVLFHVLGVILGRLSLVHGVQIELGIVALDGLEAHPQSLLDAMWVSSFAFTTNPKPLERTTEDRY